MLLTTQEISHLLVTHDKKIGFWDSLWGETGFISELRTALIRAQKEINNETQRNQVITLKILELLPKYAFGQSEPSNALIISIYQRLLDTTFVSFETVNFLRSQIHSRHFNAAEYLKNIRNSIEVLKTNKIDDGKYIRSLLTSNSLASNHSKLTSAFITLQQTNLLTDFHDKINQHYSNSIDLALKEMKRRSNLTKDSLSLLLALSPQQALAPLKIANFINSIHEQNILTPDVAAPLKKLASSSNLDKLIDAYNINEEMGALYFADFLAHPHPQPLAQSFLDIFHIDPLYLHQHTELKAKMVAMPVKLLANIKPVLSTCPKETKLVRITTLLEHSAYFLENLTAETLARLPTQFHTPERFEQITQLLTNTEVEYLIKISQLSDFIIHAIYQGRRDLIKSDAVQPTINYAQSTHNVRIHKTASESALRLKALFDNEITGEINIVINDESNCISKLDNKLNEIEKWSHTLGDSAQEQAAKRAVIRLRESRFTDPQSQITVRELLALSWIAIHSLTVENIVTGKTQLMLGLYDVQREYNLDDNGNEVSLQEDDINSCEAAPFNKFIEKLVGLHPAAILEIIRPSQAILKSIPVIREELSHYLLGLQTARRNEALTTLTIDSLNHFWEPIKDKVSARLDEEFGTGFSKSGFIEFIDSLKEMPIDTKQIRLTMLELHFRQLVTKTLEEHLLILPLEKRQEHIQQLKEDGDLQSIYPIICGRVKIALVDFVKDINISLDVDNYVARGKILHLDPSFYNFITDKKTTFSSQLYPAQRMTEHAATNNQLALDPVGFTH